MTSALTLIEEGTLADIPLGENGDIIRLDGGGFAVIAEVLGIAIMRIFDAEGAPVRNIAFDGELPAIAALPGGGMAVVTVRFLPGFDRIDTSVVSGDFQIVSETFLTASEEDNVVALAPTSDGGFVGAWAYRPATSA